jgi:ribonucleoside-diphosphate reductase alpha chain
MDTSAIEQLKTWLIYQRHWCEHKPSITVSVKEDEWLDVAAFVYKHFDEMSGVSFLPFVEHTYKQAPYQDCTEEEYKQLLNTIPQSADWAKLSEYESTDQTAGTQTFACSGNSCDVVDLTSS